VPYNVVQCGLLTRFKHDLALVTNAFGYVIHKTERALTFNILLRAAQRDLCGLQHRNSNVNIATCNVVDCGFQTRFKHDLALLTNDFGYGIHKTERALTLNILLRSTQRDL